jgi:hypothetical protein
MRGPSPTHRPSQKCRSSPTRRLPQHVRIAISRRQPARPRRRPHLTARGTTLPRRRVAPPRRASPPQLAAFSLPRRLPLPVPPSLKTSPLDPDLGTYQSASPIGMSCGPLAQLVGPRAAAGRSACVPRLPAGPRARVLPCGRQLVNCLCQQAF